MTPSSTRSRNTAVYSEAPLKRQNAWHVYVRHQERDPTHSNWDHILAKRAEFKVLPAEDKKPWAAKAKAAATRARPRRRCIVVSAWHVHGKYTYYHTYTFSTLLNTN
jgi:hypothetical protein